VLKILPFPLLLVVLVLLVVGSFILAFYNLMAGGIFDDCHLRDLKDDGRPLRWDEGRNERRFMANS